jgi:hypothetical protein
MATSEKKVGRPAKKKTNVNVETKMAEQTTNENEITTSTKKTASTSQSKIVKKIPLDLNVSCKSAVRGTLTYLSKRMAGYEIVWNDFADEEFVEFQELLSMRNTDLRFFKDNWIVIEDSDEYTAKEIMDALRVSQYYKCNIDVDNFDSLFNESPTKIKEIVSNMSNGLKETVGMRAKQLYNTGKLDSLNRINAFEEALGIELIVRG